MRLRQGHRSTKTAFAFLLTHASSASLTMLYEVLSFWFEMHSSLYELCRSWKEGKVVCFNVRSQCLPGSTEEDILSSSRCQPDTSWMLTIQPRCCVYVSYCCMLTSVLFQQLFIATNYVFADSPACKADSRQPVCCAPSSLQLLWCECGSEAKVEPTKSKGLTVLMLHATLRCLTVSITRTVWRM